MSDESGVSGPERYARESRIATGGMGEVWRARDTVLGREVAVKILKREYADDATFRARFEAEARHAAALHHTGIASVFDYGVLEEAQTPFLVMELVDGKPLSELLVDGRAFDPEQTRVLVSQAAEALGAAHAAGVVHRDVKPANLMVTPDGRIKVTDFGIARAADSVPITMTGQIIGTPHYLSPEQARGEQATVRSDVYALGVVLFECLAGHRPFGGDSPVATALAHVREDVPELPDTVPDDLVAVVHKAMAKDPAARYADGDEFAAALRGRSEQRFIPPVPPPAAESDGTQVMTGAAVPVALANTSATGGGAAPTQKRVGSRWPWVMAGLLVLLLVVLLLVTRPWEGKNTADNNTPPTPSPTKKAHPSKKPKKTVSASTGPTAKPTKTKGPKKTPSASPTDVVPSVTVSPSSQGQGNNSGQGNKQTSAGSSPAPSAAPKLAPSPPASAGASAGSNGSGG